MSPAGATPVSDAEGGVTWTGPQARGGQARVDEPLRGITPGVLLGAALQGPSLEVHKEHWSPRRLGSRHRPREHPPCIAYANLVFYVDLND